MNELKELMNYHAKKRVKKAVYISRDEVETAMEEYLKNGGEIKKLKRIKERKSDSLIYRSVKQR